MIEGKVQIGWAKTDITPPKKSLLQGQFHTRISRGTISPLTATALAVEVKADNGAVEQCVWLSCDLPGDSCKDEIVAKLEGRCPGLDLKKSP